ncbi:MAG: hypothetical protein ABFD81_10010 [Syntrophaceae bacterium]
MKRAGLISIVILPVVLWGCVLSVSPDTSETIVVEPGNTQDFAVKTTGIGSYARSFYIVDVSDPDVPLSNTIEQNNFSSVIDESSQVDLDTATYTPNEDSAGKYTVLYAVEFGTPSTELEMVLLKIMESIHSRMWQVVVRGVAITPKRNISAVPGTTMTYTATAYPEGDYDYEWRLDGVSVATGAAYAFRPTTAQCGTHRLSVTASGDEAVYTLMREITVSGS